MRINLDLLPPTAQHLVKLIGLEPALLLVRHYGGRVIQPTRGLTDGSAARMAALAECIGPTAADTLAAHYRNSPLSVPACVEAMAAARRQDIRAEFDRRTRAGESARSVVDSLAGPPPRFSSRYIWKLLGEVDSGQVRDTAQAELF